MVKTGKEIPKLRDGSLDLDSWTSLLAMEGLDTDVTRINSVSQLVADIPVNGGRYLESGSSLAQLLADLGMDSNVLMAALLYRPVRAGVLVEDSVQPLLGDGYSKDIFTLIQSVIRMGTVSLLEMSNTRMQTIEERDQVDNIKRMFVSLIDDPRVAVLKLAERIIALRSAKGADDKRRKRIAKEAYLVFSPLAGRLGIWQLKWELEDLALRYLEPDVYMSIAKQLDQRRTEREEEIEEIAELLKVTLKRSGIESSVIGRAKNIFSIYRKMQTKKVGVDQVYDIRAVRVLVDDISDCYSALGIIHTHWQHIPSEFDDYLACPKENGYRSIHTAVIGPTGETLEVQIRTFGMDKEAELGVCAHWSYKGDANEDNSYSQKMDWFRQFVDMSDDIFADSFVKQMRMQFANFREEERIFVYTPKGHVIDLTVGATPLDFAYRVHTEIGHRCIGAKVDGRQTRLNMPLKSGQRIEILIGKYESPERSWLDFRLGFIRTSRAREKIQSWFRERPEYENRAFVLTLLSDSFSRIGIEPPERSAVHEAGDKLGFSGETALIDALAVGDCQISEVIGALCDPDHGDLSSVFGGGMPIRNNPFKIEIQAADRDDLLRDITAILSQSHISITSISSDIDLETKGAIISLEIYLSSMQELVLIIEELTQVPDVVDVRRKTNDNQK